MKRRRLFTQTSDLTQKTPCEVFLSPDESRYASKVLRLQERDEVELIDGMGHSAKAILKHIPKRGEISAEVTEIFTHPLPPKMTLFSACPKGERSSWMAEKLTEVGISEIIWVEFARSQPLRIPLARQKNRAKAALRQSGGYYLPQIRSIGSVQSLFAQTSNKEGLFYIASPSHNMNLTTCLKKVAKTHCQQVTLVIGPEGGFTGEEMAKWDEKLYTGVSLGTQILRIETAALVFCGALHGAFANPLTSDA